MNLHEYQAKEILRQFSVPVPSGKVVRKAAEAEATARSLGGEKFAVKAQIHAGGRGKAGGVLLVTGASAVREAAEKLLGKTLKTPQTGPAGQPVGQVLIEVQTGIAKEFYAAVIFDRSQEKPCLVFSPSGGVEIEEVARKSPGAIWKQTFSPRAGLSLETAKEFLIRRGGVSAPWGPTGYEPAGPAYRPGRRGDRAPTLPQILVNLARVFLETDASLVEVNPLAETPSGEFLALDAKIRLDDNGLERHPELAQLRDPRQEDPREQEAKKFDLSYVGLEGNIGCMVNGAGLAMATMDLIQLAGGEPANFLDVGGGANKEKVTAAFKIILADPKVKAILVNIFGGIMRCDVVAEGIVGAIRDGGAAPRGRPQGTHGGVPLQIPLVVRLEGTRVKEGKEILKQSGLKIISVESLEEAAQKVVACVHSR